MYIVCGIEHVEIRIHALLQRLNIGIDMHVVHWRRPIGKLNGKWSLLM